MRIEVEVCRRLLLLYFCQFLDFGFSGTVKARMAIYISGQVKKGDNEVGSTLTIFILSFYNFHPLSQVL